MPERAVEDPGGDGEQLLDEVERLSNISINARLELARICGLVCFR